MTHYGVIYGQTTDYGEYSVAMRVQDERCSEVRENVSVWKHKDNCINKWHELGLSGMTIEEANEIIRKLERSVHIERTNQRLSYMPGLHDIGLISWND